ncbi:MAG: hypothetical protein ACOYM2_08130 [Rectinemataceae bacterium]
MNTIPITLSDGAVPYTVVGGSRGTAGPPGVPVSLVILDRGPRLFRSETLRDFDKLGFDSILCVEEKGELFDVETLCQRFPRLRFIVLGAPADMGTRVNIAIRESSAPYVFVLWNDMGLSTAGLSGRFFERLVEQDLLCLAPFLTSGKGEPIPTAATPALHHSSLKILPLSAGKDATASLYPFDYCGIYSKERFTLLGGYDGRLANPFWQRLDFGFRAWLWGEEIRLAQALRVNYDEAPPEADESIDADYRWFWLKNVAPQFRGDTAVLSRRRRLEYLLSRRREPLQALAEFKAAREWVALNRYRFCSDANSLVDLWEDDAR